jgi:hypothetical protein
MMARIHAQSDGSGSGALSIEYKLVTELKPHTRNARIHSRHQIRQIADSIGIFGFTNPVLVDRNDFIVAGHGRVEAAKLLGLERVPTIRLEGLSDDQLRAYIIADNKVAENAGWDKEILAVELQHLLTLDCAEFEVTLTGFEIPEIDMILEESRNHSEIEELIPEPILDRQQISSTLPSSAGRGPSMPILRPACSSPTASFQTRPKLRNCS